MKSLDAISALERQSAALRARGATSLYLFGSTAADRATESSDLDLFIDYDADTRFSLLDLVGMQTFLETQLQMRVDLTTRDSLDPLLRTKIEMSAIRVF